LLLWQCVCPPPSIPLYNNKQPPNAVIFAIQSTRPTWKILAIYACMKYQRVCMCVMYVCVFGCVCVCLSLALPVPPTPSSIHAHSPVQSNRSPQLCVLPRCLAFQLASHQKLDACLFYWHVNLCGALPLLHIVVQVFHFCIYCIYNCVLCVFYK